MKSLLRSKKRIKQGFLVLATGLLCVIFANFSMAANVITNGTFNGNLDNWTLSKAASSSTDDGVLYNTDTATADGTGCMRGQTRLEATWVGNATQNFTVNSGVISANLNFTWRKWALADASRKHDIKVELIDPGSTTRYTWTDTATKGVGTGSWNVQSNIDVKSNIQAGTTGSWTIKISWDLQAGKDKGYCGADFDDISLDITCDTTPPTTTVSVDPTNPDGDNGWYITNPTVTLTRDEPGTTYYQWTPHPQTTPTAGFSTYSIPIQPDQEGWRDLWYYSVDNYTNQEVTKLQDFKVDTSHPSSTVTAPADGSYITSGTTYTVTGTADDTSPGSKVVGVDVSPDGGTNWYAATNTGTDFSTWEYIWTLPGDGIYTVQPKATDKAGNVETPGAGNSVTIDMTPPTVASTDPPDGSVGVANAANIYTTFSESMEAGTITTSTFTLHDNTSDTPVVGSVSYDGATKKATFDPTSDLQTDHNYTAMVTTGVKDVAGNNMASNYTWDFSTRPPQIPSGFTVQAQDGKNHLSWDINPEPLVFYRIYRASSEDGSYHFIDPTDVGVTTYNDTGYGNKQYYWYKILAVDQGTQNESSQTSAVKNDDVYISKSLSASSGGTLDAANGEVALSIPAGALSADATVHVDETTTPAGLTLVSDYFDIGLGGATLSSGATLTVKYDTSNPESSVFMAHWDGSNWSYAGGTVNALNSTVSLTTTIFSGYGASSDTTPPVWPAAPNIFLESGSGHITVTWTAASDAESDISGYNIFRSIDSIVDATDEWVGSVDGTTLIYQDDSVIPGEDYYYDVRAVNGAGLTAFSGNPAGPEHAEGTEKPHGVYENNTDLCKDCHETHDSEGSTFIFRRETQKITCLVCHDGTGSSTDIESKFGYAATTGSAHSLEPDTEPDNSTIKYCDSCHTPHFDPTGTAKLVRDPIRGTTVTGNDNTVCFACHEKLSYLTITTDAWWGETIYNASKHATGTATNALGTYPDTSYTRGLCLNCHDVHGSQYTDLQRDTSYLASEKNQLCYMCHDDSSISFGSTYSYRGKTTYTASAHGTSTSTYNHWPTTADTGAGLGTGGAEAKQCINCHNPHGKDRGDGTAFDYLLLRWGYGTGTYKSDEEYLCYGVASGTSKGTGCHSQSFAYDIADTTFYGGGTRNIWDLFNPSTIREAGAIASTAKINQRHDISYYDQNTYNAGAKIECDDCHNPHINNDDYDFSTKSRIADPDGTTSNFTSKYATSNTYGGNSYRSAATDLDPSFGNNLPDFVAYCLACHDNDSLPSSVSWGTAGATKDIDSVYFSLNQHGSVNGYAAGYGTLKPPWQNGSYPYAALNCTDCHEPHGSDGLYHLKTSIVINGTTLTTGGSLTEYVVINNNYGNSGTGGSYIGWCSFCHDISSHKNTSCGNCHDHGDSRF